ncbi:7-cyano-7-deazaguanine reductase [Gammaproteobacteria bacterium]|nr:7-cyano-7-deazaguanine reductase [Gammaproteobacteria bacterium]MDA8720126.1 7-cyano-7-deazaguanine reductase [bacterium]MDA8925284.1 7-cyano-7-deazaguanine reductase [Gammaproteobacteria bacterium]MDA9365103.1 7-cyano-7-deazaguanine reductase [Gammaproteobacteria bacterium]MDA9973657.1 7-cyano-7-deazaguanine reductase [Gammaproteobacteria bacterium]
MKVKFLGKHQGVSEYSPALLDAVNRNNIESMASYFGYDLWTAYEFSYLNSLNQPVLEILEIKIPKSTLQTVESKSLKLYLASFYKRKFNNIQSALQIIERDLSRLLDGKVKVKKITKLIHPPKSYLIHSGSKTIARNRVIRFEGFRSICPVTSQPDWATIYFHSTSNSMNLQKLGKLLKSYREQGDFHETCIEDIFLQLYKDQNLTNLTVFGRFLRRGGIDINPMRSTHSKPMFSHFRDIHQ